MLHALIRISCGNYPTSHLRIVNFLTAAPEYVFKPLLLFSLLLSTRCEASMRYNGDEWDHGLPETLQLARATFDPALHTF